MLMCGKQHKFRELKFIQIHAGYKWKLVLKYSCENNFLVFFKKIFHAKRQSTLWKFFQRLLDRYTTMKNVINCHLGIIHKYERSFKGAFRETSGLRQTHKETLLQSFASLHLKGLSHCNSHNFSYYLICSIKKLLVFISDYICPFGKSPADLEQSTSGNKLTSTILYLTR